MIMIDPVLSALDKEIASLEAQLADAAAGSFAPERVIWMAGRMTTSRWQRCRRNILARLSLCGRSSIRRCAGPRCLRWRQILARRRLPVRLDDDAAERAEDAAQRAARRLAQLMGL